MVDWATAADLATAGGTALLSVATFFSTRSANTAARSAERAVQDGLRPVLVPSRWSDEAQKVRFVDGRWMVVRGGRATLEFAEDGAYLVLSIRNVGRGLAVLHGWDLREEAHAEHRRPAAFHRLTRDIYIPPGDTGFCQVAVRDPGGAEYALLQQCRTSGEGWIDVLYGDSEGGQRVISRMALTIGPNGTSEDGQWALTGSRHWNLDRPAPR